MPLTIVRWFQCIYTAKNPRINFTVERETLRFKLSIRQNGDIFCSHCVRKIARLPFNLYSVIYCVSLLFRILCPAKDKPCWCVEWLRTVDAGLT